MGKDVLQRVGSKGVVADLTRVLVARLTPALLPPEVLHAAMEEAEGSQEGGWGAGCGHMGGVVGFGTRKQAVGLVGRSCCSCP